MRLSQNVMTLVTFVAGGALTQGGAWVQRRWRLKDDATVRQELRAAELEDRRLARMDAACEQILDAIHHVPQLVRVGHADEGVPDEVLAHAASIVRQAYALPDEVHEQLFACAGLIWWSDVVEEDVGVSRYSIVANTCGFAADIAAAVLRRETPPPKPEWYVDWTTARAAALEREKAKHVPRKSQTT